MNAQDGQAHVVYPKTADVFCTPSSCGAPSVRSRYIERVEPDLREYPDLRVEKRKRPRETKKSKSKKRKVMWVWKQKV
jgi:hypothetical protein